ncbi:MAG: hypothetical protein EAZ85_00200 [Bacteroidetes bacterium]|nr:MAG: hypothetical protein EAZ85_00200 [Bacteroidota bacterium]TAG90574.1 MAG: hypothetical protein EAZ20_04105 [Bacteroidota bacterium]
MHTSIQIEKYFFLTDIQFLLKSTMTILEFLKFIHIFAGSLTLLSGFIAITSKKGRTIHRLSGKVFFWAMTLTTVLAVNASIFKPKFYFFIPIAIISFYQVASGYRILFIKTLHKGQSPQIVDWVLTLGMLVTSFVFVFLGIMNLEKDIFYSIVLFSFSTIGLYCCIIDLYNYIQKPKNKFYWLFIHIFRMSHGFIAGLTAFLVTNSKLFPFLPQVLLLIIPIAIGQPIISLVIWNYNRKLKKTKHLEIPVKLDSTFDK